MPSPQAHRPLRLSLFPLLLACASVAATAAPVAGSSAAAVDASPAATVALPAAYARWQSSMDAFAAADRERHPQTDGVLFVGSSTIRLWSDLREDFRQLPVVINRGFGGSTMADCNYFVKSLVVQYQPRHVMVYAGDNDLAEGRTPAQVLESFQSFVTAVRTALPQTRISYISIKPSPLRASLLPRAREANALLASYVRTLPNSDYIDIFTPMMAADGSVRTDLFGPDRLHMNDAGYDLWRSVISAYVGRDGVMQAREAAPAAATGPATAAVAVPAAAGGIVRVSVER